VEIIMKNGIMDKDRKKLFKEFVTDVRGVATTRSTIAKNRIMPSRIPRHPMSAVRTGPPPSKRSKPTWQY